MINKLRAFKNLTYSKLKDLKFQISILRAISQFPDLTSLTSPYFIIGIPGSLCLVNLCIKYFPENQKCIFVANGLDQFELNWAKKNLSVENQIVINQTLPHAYVLDLLFDQYQKPFSIIDFDCFVLNSAYFTKLKALESDSMMNALFCYENKELNLEMFETYMLFLNTPLINKIKSKFNVNSRVQLIDRLPDYLKERLMTLGIDNTHYPDLHHRGNFFDTMRLIYLLGLTEGYKCHFLEKFPFYPMPNNNVFHVGSGHKNWSLGKIHLVRGTYLWRRALETCNDQILQDYYWKQYGNMRSSDIFTHAPDQWEKIGSEFIEFVEKIINDIN